MQSILSISCVAILTASTFACRSRPPSSDTKDILFIDPYYLAIVETSILDQRSQKPKEPRLFTAAQCLWPATEVRQTYRQLLTDPSLSKHLGVERLNEMAKACIAASSDKDPSRWRIVRQFNALQLRQFLDAKMKYRYDDLIKSHDQRRKEIDAILEQANREVEAVQATGDALLKTLETLQSEDAVRQAIGKIATQDPKNSPQQTTTTERWHSFDIISSEMDSVSYRAKITNVIEETRAEAALRQTQTQINNVTEALLTSLEDNKNQENALIRAHALNQTLKESRNEIRKIVQHMDKVASCLRESADNQEKFLLQILTSDELFDAEHFEPGNNSPWEILAMNCAKILQTETVILHHRIKGIPYSPNLRSEYESLLIPRDRISPPRVPMLSDGSNPVNYETEYYKMVTAKVKEYLERENYFSYFRLFLGLGASSKKDGRK